MAGSPPARAAAQQGQAAPTLRVGPGRAPRERLERAARFLEPAVSHRADAGGLRVVRPPREAQAPVPAEPPAARVQLELPDLGVPLARAVRPPEEAREALPAEPPVGPVRAVAPARVALRHSEG